MRDSNQIPVVTDIFTVIFVMVSMNGSVRIAGFEKKNEKYFRHMLVTFRDFRIVFGKSASNVTSCENQYKILSYL